MSDLSRNLLHLGKSEKAPKMRALFRRFAVLVFALCCGFDVGSSHSGCISDDQPDGAFSVDALLGAAAPTKSPPYIDLQGSVAAEADDPVRGVDDPIEMLISSIKQKVDDYYELDKNVKLIMDTESSQITIQRLKLLLRDKDPEVRRLAAEAVGLFGSAGSSCLSDLTVLLKDVSSKVRESAALSLGQIAPDYREAVPALVDLFKSGDESDRVAAIATLGQFGKLSVPHVIEGLTDRSPRVRLEAVEALAWVGADPREAVPALIELLKRGDESDRVAVVASLGRLGKVSVPHLIEAVKDRSPKVRLVAVEALASADPDPREAVPALIELLKRGDESDRVAVVASLGRFGKVSVPHLIEAVKDRSPKVRLVAIEALASAGPDAPQIVDVLKSSLQDESDEVRASSAGVLGRAGQSAKSAVPSLVIATSDRSPAVRRMALWALSAITPGNPAVAVQICSAYKDTIVRIRERVLEYLDTVESDSPAPEIIELLSLASGDEDPGIRDKAVDMLVRLRSESWRAVPLLIERFRIGCSLLARPHAPILAGATAVPALIDALNDENEVVRYRGAEDLGLVGPLARPAVSVLIECLDDADMEVRNQAAHALVQIGGVATPALALALGEPASDVDSVLIKILGEIGPDARSAVPRLSDILRQRDSAIDRAAVITALGRIAPNDPGVRQILTAASRDRSWGIRVAAVDAIEDAHGSPVPPVDEWIKDLAADPSTVFQTAERLGKLGPRASASIPALLDLAHDKRELIRTAGALALGRIGSPATPRLLEALMDRDVRLRRHASKALSSRISASPTELPALLRAVKDTDPIVRIYAIRALGLHGANLSAVAPAVLAAIRGNEEDLREAGVWALCRMVPESLTILTQLLRSPDVVLRQTAARVLCYVGAEARSSLPALTNSLVDDDPLVRNWARQAVIMFDPRGAGTSASFLRATGNRKGVARLLAVRDLRGPLIRQRTEIARQQEADRIRPLLLASLAGHSPPEKRWAAAELARLSEGNIAALEQLVSALGDRDVVVRCMAASALESIGPGAAAATSALAKSLRDDEDWEMRWRAAKALGAIGPRARISLPFLRDALKDESPWTRLAAADALWEVDRWDSGTLSVLIELVEGVLNFTRRP